MRVFRPITSFIAYKKNKIASEKSSYKNIYLTEGHILVSGSFRNYEFISGKIKIHED